MGEIGLGTILGIGAQMAANAQNNWANQELNYQQYQQQQHLMGLQFGYNEQAAQKADERTRALYTDLQSPAAMVNQMQQAGLSPGLIYGQSGMGGSLQQGAQGGGANIPSRQVFGMNPLLDAQTAILTATAEKTKAETENTKADTKKTEAETESTWKDIPIKEKQLIVMDWSIDQMKQNIEESKKRIELLGEEICNKMADTDLKKDQAKLTQAQTEFQKALKEWQDAQTKLAEIDAKTRGEFNKTQIAEMKANIHQAYKSAKTMEELAKKYGAEAEGQRIQNSINKFTMMDQVKGIIYKNILAQMEAGTFMQGKKIEWREAKARTDKLIEETIEKGWSNKAYEDAKYLFGEAGAGYLKVLIEEALPW